MEHFRDSTQIFLIDPPARRSSSLCTRSSNLSCSSFHTASDSKSTPISGTKCPLPPLPFFLLEEEPFPDRIAEV